MCLIFQDTDYTVVHWSVVNIRHLLRNTLEFKYLIWEINKGLIRIHKQPSLQWFSHSSRKQHWWIAVCQTVGSCSAWWLKMQFAVLSLQADIIQRDSTDETWSYEKRKLWLFFTCTLQSTLTVTSLLTYSSSMQAFHPRSSPLSACMSSSVRLNWKICVKHPISHELGKLPSWLKNLSEPSTMADQKVQYKK